jgi:hypothetical protein
VIFSFGLKVCVQIASARGRYAPVGYDIDRETHTLELLKLRFGETSLHKCEVGAALTHE